ncbi:MAG: hypothetical protein Q8S24_10845 [Eubacteriales bacterium]|nr:hypothetical protein [Eubacteriales bacterium]
MIIESFLQVKKYLPAITIKHDITSLDDMFNVVENELTENILSEELHNRLDEKREEDKSLFIQCERIISLTGFIRAIPDLDLVLTQSGFAVHNSEAMAPASTARVKALTNSLQERVDNAIDTLIRYLLSSEKYEDIWRVTPQFEKITSGLISTYSDFKEYAQYSPSVASQYPKSYSDFQKLYPNFNLALMGEISSYLSADYCSEIIEKIRDRENISTHEKYVINLIKYAICAMSMNDLPSGRVHVIKACSYMMKYPNTFQTFISSPEGQALDNTDNDRPIFSML